MTQVIIDIKAIRSKQGNFIFEAISNSGQIIKSELLLSEFDNYNEFASWLINQTDYETINTNYRKRFIIDFHSENDYRIIDNLIVENLPEEIALTDIANIPNWSNWTRQQALDWININVTNLATAKTAISALAEMVILLRDVAKGSKRSIE